MGVLNSAKRVSCTCNNKFSRRYKEDLVEVAVSKSQRKPRRFLEAVHRTWWEPTNSSNAVVCFLARAGRRGFLSMEVAILFRRRSYSFCSKNIHLPAVKSTFFETCWTSCKFMDFSTRLLLSGINPDILDWETFQFLNQSKSRETWFRSCRFSLLLPAPARSNLITCFASSLWQEVTSALTFWTINSSWKAHYEQKFFNVCASFTMQSRKCLDKVSSLGAKSDSEAYNSNTQPCCYSSHRSRVGSKQI